MEDCQQVPSVFSITACDSLKSGLREALRYLLDNVRQIDRIRRLPIPQTDEILLLIDLLIEYNHLRTYNASYSENLYSLVRVTGNTETRIQRVLPSLVCLTVIPYIKRKFDRYFEELNYNTSRTPDDLHKIRIYKNLSRLCSIVDLICLLRFAAGKSAYHNPIDGLLNIRLMINDQHNEDDQVMKPLADRISRIIADWMGRGLTIGSYFIQFLDYWNAHSNSAPLLSASLPIPDPPKLDEDERIHKAERSLNICLICLQVRQNECALSNTGYVFCYSCLQRYVKNEHKCPVTGQPTTSDNIVKLFTSTPS